MPLLYVLGHTITFSPPIAICNTHINVQVLIVDKSVNFQRVKPLRRHRRGIYGHPEVVGPPANVRGLLTIVNIGVILIGYHCDCESGRLETLDIKAGCSVPLGKGLNA